MAGTELDPEIARCIADYKGCSFGSCDPEVDGGAIGIWWYPVGDAGDVSTDDPPPPDLYDICVASFYCSCSASFQIRDGDSMRSASVEEFCTFIHETNETCDNCLATYTEYYV